MCTYFLSFMIICLALIVTKSYGRGYLSKDTYLIKTRVVKPWEKIVHKQFSVESVLSMSEKNERYYEYASEINQLCKIVLHYHVSVSCVWFLNQF